MGKPPPITIPTEPVGSIPRRVDLIEQVSRGENEPINLSYLRKGLRLSARALPRSVTPPRYGRERWAQLAVNLIGGDL